MRSQKIGAEADGERSDVEHQAADRDERPRRAAGAEDEDEGEQREGDGHDRAAPEQQRPAPGPVEEADRDERHPDVDDADGDRREDRRRGRVDARVPDDRRSEIDDRVDARDLLQDCQADADHEGRLDDRVAQVLPAAGLLDDAVGDLVELCVDQRRVVLADRLEDGLRLVAATCHDQPARALGHLQHADQEEDRGNGAEGEHGPPVLAAVEDQADGIGDDDPDRDGELEERDESSADVGGRDLGDVDRGGGGCEPDRDSDQHAGDHQHDLVGRGGGADRSDDEDDRGADDQDSPAVLVGEASCESGADHGADGDGGHHEARAEAAQPEVRLDEEQGARDDAGVVAEEEAAEAGDRGGRDDHPHRVLARCLSLRAAPPRAHGGDPIRDRGAANPVRSARGQHLLGGGLGRVELLRDEVEAAVPEARVGEVDADDPAELLGRAASRPRRACSR